MNSISLRPHTLYARVYRLLSVLVALTLLFNGIAPAFVSPGLAGAAEPEETPLSQRGQVTLPGPMGTTVNLFSGNLYKGVELFNFDALLPLNFTLSYNSLLQDQVVRTGYYGWRHNYEIEYQETGDGAVLIVWGDGRYDRYTPAGNGHYLPPPGVATSLYRSTATSLVLTMGDKTVYYFDSARHNQVTRIQHPSGQSLVFSYNLYGKLIRVTHSLGYTLTLSYAADGEVWRLVNVADSTPGATYRSVSMSEVGDGNLGSVTNAAGETTTFSYGGGQALVSIEGPPGGKVFVAYGGDRVQSLTGSGVSLYLAYNIAASEYGIQQVQTAVIEVVGGVKYRSSFVFDERGRLTLRSDPFQNTYRITWDDNDNPVRFEDEKGHITRLTYDDHGRIITMTDPLNRITSYSYDPVFGFITSFTDPEDKTTTYSYDGAGNLVRMRLPSGGEYEYTYGPQGLLATATDPGETTTHYDYDSFGRLSSMIDPQGETTLYEYDHRGNLLHQTDPAGVEAILTWDNLDRLLTLSDGVNQPISHVYDDNGNLSQLVDPNGHAYTYQYSPLGWLTTVDDPLNYRTSYKYDERGNLLQVTDAEGEVWRFTYDGLNRLTGETDPAGRTTGYAYDAAGNLTAVTGPDGLTTYYTYDAADQLTGVDFSDGNDEHYLYDDVGRVIEAGNDDVTMEYAYNGLGLPVEVTITSAEEGVQVVSYEYDKMGRTTGMVDPDNGSTVYTYTVRGQLAAVAAPEGITSFTYDAAGRLERQDNANGTYTLAGYDAAGRLFTLHHYQEDGTLITWKEYGYDAAGNTTSVTDSSGMATFDYDPLDRLSGAVYPDGLAIGYRYDAVGNRIGEANSETGNTGYSYSQAHELLTMETPQETVAFTYNQRGNLATRQDASGLTTYTFDTDNRLRSILNPDGGEQEYRYYPGRQHLRWAGVDLAGDITTYYYDGTNVLLASDGTGVTVARYTAGLAPDQWLSMQQGGEYFTFHQDILGSVNALTNAAGDVVSTQTYDPFGNVLSSTGVDSPFGFTGRPYDPRSGLYDYRARFYDPAAGRFLSRDPLPGRRFLPSSLHPYAYVLNNPLGYTDPSGELIGVVVGVVGIIGGFLWWLHGTMEDQQKEVDRINRIKDPVKRIQAWTEFRRKKQLRNLSEAAQKAIEAEKKLITAMFPDPENMPDDVKEWMKKVDKDFERIQDWGYKGAVYGQDGAKASASATFGTNTPGATSGDTQAPPIGPGNDHADDTFSAASGQYPLAGSTGLIKSRPPFTAAPRATAGTPAFRGAPRVALLWHGFAEEAAAFLNAIGEPYDILQPDFAPSLAGAYPILLIPSGGLYGLENAPSFRARLQAYAENGGVILVSAQQHGYEYGALPGDLKGYGWSEDQSCFAAAVSLPLFHQAVSGFDVAQLDLLVDGYFTDYPDDATILMERNKNGYPAALLYPVGDGYAMATTAYADWGSSNYQHTRHDHRLWRDLIAWATLGALHSYSHTLPEHSPGEAATVDVNVDNTGGVNAEAIRLLLLNPDKGLVAQEVVSQTVAAGSSQTLSYDLITGSELGLWTLDYVLLDGDGSAIQAQAIGAAFAVSDPAEAVGPNRPFDFWITAPTELWQRDTAGDFVFHVRNRSASPAGGVTVQYRFHHHYYEEGGGAAYRGILDFGTIAAGAEVTRTASATILTPDRLFGDLYTAGSPNNVYRAGTSFQIRVKPMVVTITPAPDQNAYRPGEEVVIDTILGNEEETNLEVVGNLAVYNQAGQVVYQDGIGMSLPALGEVQVSHAYSLPVDASVGVHNIVVQLDTKGVSGRGSATYRVLEPLLAVTLLEPDIYQPAADNPVSVHLTNIGAQDVLSETFTATLLDPAGATIWSDSQSISVAASETSTVDLLIPFTEQFGAYTLQVGVTGVVATSHKISLSAAVVITMDKTEYKAGGEMGVAVKTANTGCFSEALQVTLTVPDAAYEQADALSLDPGEVQTTTHTINLPAGLASGSYPLTATITLSSSSNLLKGDTFVVPPPKLQVEAPAGPVSGGESLVVYLRNVGGTAMTPVYDLRLQDRTGAVLDSEAGTTSPVAPGGTTSVSLSLPAGALSGYVYVRGDASILETGESQRLTRAIPVDGVEADLKTAMAQPVYTGGDLLQATTSITSSGAALNGATLNLAVNQPAAGGGEAWITHMRGDHNPLYDYLLGTAIDPAGHFWFATIMGISVLDTGGTPFDKSDDRWQAFTTDDGLPYHYVYGIDFDDNGYAWLATGGGLAVLDTNNTLFVKSDDRWQTFYTQNTKAVAVEGANIVWTAYDYYNLLNFGLRVLDHNGTPFDKGDDTWQSFSTTDGMPANGAYAITIDDDGNKWIASNNQTSTGGVAVLDDNGTPLNKADDTWTTFTTADGLLGLNVRDIKIDANGVKWLATNPGGLNALDDGADPFNHDDDIWAYFNNSNSPLLNRVNNLLIDDAGRKWCWVGGVGWAGADVLDDGGDPFNPAGHTWVAFRKADGLGTETLDSYMVQDSTGNIWIGHSDAGYVDRQPITVLDINNTLENKDDDQVLTYSRYDGLAYNDFSSMAVDSLNRKWIPYIYEDKNGVSILDENGTPFDKVDDRWAYIPSSGCSNCNGLNGNTIRGMIADETDFIWFGGTELDVLDYGGTPGDTADDLWQNFGLTDGWGSMSWYDTVIDFDSNGYLWTANGTTIKVLDHGGTPFDKSNDRWMSFGTADGMAGTSHTLDVDSQDRKWIGTYNGLSVLDDGGTPFDKLDDQWLTFVKEDGWSPPGISNDVYTVLADSNDNIWVGAQLVVAVLDHNGTPLDKGDDTWQTFTSADILPANTSIRSITEGDDGRIWIGTYDTGVIVLDHGGTPLDKSDDTWERYATPRYSDIIVLDKLGYRWIGTPNRGKGIGASMVGELSGQELWQSSRSVDLPGNYTFDDTVDIVSPEGKFYLKTTLTAPGGEVIAADSDAFYVFPGTTALTMEAGESAYRPGETITLTGEVMNNGVTPIANQSLAVSQDGTTVYNEGPFDVAAGASHPFTVTATAPANPGNTRFVAMLGSLTIEDEVAVIAPDVSAGLDGPDLWGSDPFTLTLIFTNSAAIDGRLTVDINGDLQPLTVPAGENLVHTMITQIMTDTTYVVTIGGDLEQVLTHTVLFGEDVASQFDPDDLYCSGPVEIPYTLANTGQLPVGFNTTVDVSGPSPAAAVLSDYLLPGGVESDYLAVGLAAGDYMVAWSTPYDGGSAPFRVAPPDQVEMSAAVGPVVDATAPLTVTVDNDGCTIFSGTLTVEATTAAGSFYNEEMALSLAIDAGQSPTFTLSTAAATPGPYTATITLRDEASALWSQALLTGTVPGPELVVTALPATNLLPAGQTVTMTFEVSNQGEVGDEARLAFQLGDIEDDQQTTWLDMGESAVFDFPFFIPKDMPTSDVVVSYVLSGQLSGDVENGILPLTVAGISLTVTAATEHPTFFEGEEARIDLAINNSGLVDTGELVALTVFNSITQTHAISLTPGSSTTLPFTYTATFRGDRKVFYGIYGIFEDRGAYLNTLYLNQAHSGVTLVLDKEVASPADTVQASLVTTLTSGLLNAYVFGESYTQTLGVDTAFSFIVPADAARGSQAVHYVVQNTGTVWDGREQAAWFDVDAPNIRVLESKLKRTGKTLTITLTVASDRAMELTAEGWLVYPDRSAGPASGTPVHLEATRDNRVVLAAVLDQAQMGLHWFMYQLVDENGVIRAAGGEAFDAGLASLDRITLDQEAYANPDDTVTASLEIFSSQATAATIALVLDDGPVTGAPVDLQVGYQTLDVVLDGPIPAGARTLTGTLTAAGDASSQVVAFVYGTGLPDLAPGQPVVADETITAVVANVGQGDAGASVARFTRDGGILIGTAPLAALPVSDTAVISLSWPAMGAGGPHIVAVTVDAGEEVAEFDEGNNQSQAAVTIPRLSLESLCDRDSYVLGETVIISANLSNYAPAGRPAMLKTTIYDPTGQVVHQDERSLQLPTGHSVEEIDWPSAGQPVGMYTVHQRLSDAEVEAHSDYALFSVILIAPTAGFTSNSPVTLGKTSHFTNTTTGPGVISYAWDFGDGSPILTGANPNHQYAAAGVYTVVMTATNEAGSDVFSALHEVVEGRAYLYLPAVMNNVSAMSNIPAGIQGRPAGIAGPVIPWLRHPLMECPIVFVECSG